MAAIFGKKRNFLNWADKIYLNTLCVENFNEIALSPTVNEIEKILYFAKKRNFVFCIFGKNSKWLTYLEERENFKNWQGV